MSKNKWGQVVEARMAIEKDMREKGITIKQPLNPKTIKAYQDAPKLEKNADNPEKKDNKPSILSTFINRFKRSSSDAPPPSSAAVARSTSHTNMLNLLSPRSEGEKVDDYKARLKQQIESSGAHTQSRKQQTTGAQSEQRAEQKSVAISPRSSSINASTSSSSSKAAPATEPETEEHYSPSLGGRK